MGNKSIRDPLSEMQSANLTEAEQLQIEETFFNFDFKKFTVEFEQFKEKYASSINLEDMFPVRSKFSPKDAEEATGEEKRLLNEVI